MPRALRIKLRTGDVMSLIGWACMAFGSIFVWIFVANSELITLVEFRGETAGAEGQVTGVSGTSMSVNEQTVMRVSFAFTDAAGVERRGSSYTTGSTPSGRVAVEYLADDPTVSRIRGMNNRPFPAMVAFVLIFPGIGLVFAAMGWRRGGKAIRLLRIGVVGEGTLVSTRPTNTRINKQTVYEYTFEFEVHGRKYRAVGRTHRDELTDDEREPLLYDPGWPPNATMLDHLPGKPRIDDEGAITMTWGVGSVAAIALPIAFATVNAVGWLIHSAL